MYINEIFKVPVYESELDLDVKELNSFCNALEKVDKGRIISNVGGYQSHNLPVMTKRQPIRTLVEEIEKHSSAFAKGFINNNEQVVTDMWFNINRYKDSNRLHNHPTCDIGGVYYTKTPVDCGNIRFVHPASDALSYYYAYQQERTESNEYNSEEWLFEPKENVLFLFPAWLNHYVTPNNNKEEQRISFSFNCSTKSRVKK